MRNTEILIGSHVWSRKTGFSWIMFIFFSPGQYDTKNKQYIYIKWSFSFNYFERYVNWKNDYLELLLSVYVVFIQNYILSKQSQVSETIGAPKFLHVLQRKCIAKTKSYRFALKLVRTPLNVLLHGF